MSKPWRSILLTESKDIWTKARANRGLPPPMPGLNEIKYICISYKEECMVSPFFIFDSILILKETQWFIGSFKICRTRPVEYRSLSLQVFLCDLCRETKLVSCPFHILPVHVLEPPISSVHKGIYMLQGAEVHDERLLSVFKMVPCEVSRTVPSIEPVDELLTDRLTAQDVEQHTNGIEVDANTNSAQLHYYKKGVEVAKWFLLSAQDDAQRKLVVEILKKKATEKMRVRTDSCILWFVYLIGKRKNQFDLDVRNQFEVAHDRDDVLSDGLIEKK